MVQKEIYSFWTILIFSLFYIPHRENVVIGSTATKKETSYTNLESVTSTPTTFKHIPSALLAAKKVDKVVCQLRRRSMASCLYRKSSNEVLKWHLTQPFNDADFTYFGVAIDPLTPNGTTVRDTTIDPPGPRRALGQAKVYVPGSNTIQNATQGEIDSWAAFEVSDQNDQDLELAQGMLDNTARFSNKTIRKAFTALLKRIIAENNTMATQWNFFRAEVASANSLSALKSGVANNTSDAPIRTIAQAKTALMNDLDPND